MRIWHQSITDLTELPNYRAMLADHAERICRPGTHVELHGTEPGTYPPGVSPIDVTVHPWCHYLATVQVVQNVKEAERQGYDAVASSCFFDPGLREARSLVDIPVVSMCETSLLVSASLGRTVGLLGLGGTSVPFLRDLVESYGFGSRLAAVVGLEPPITERELDPSYGGASDVIARVESAARRAIGAGAEVIIPAEGVLNTLLVRNGLHEVDGAPVLDSFGAVLAHAEMLAHLQRETGLRVSRMSTYPAPDPDLVDHLAKLAAEQLVASSPPSSTDTPD